MTKNIYVTGASGDLGRAVMRAVKTHGFLPHGFDLIESDQVQAVDLADEGAVKDAFNAVAKAEGAPIGLINCVGKYEGLEVSATSVADFLRIQTANVTATWISCIEFEKICADDSLIVNLASISGKYGSKDAAYGTSKAAVIGLTKSLALAFGPRIRVNAVAPGVIDSGIARRIPGNRAEEHRDSSILGRFGETSEVAELIMSLFSPAGSWMTGSIIDINGGIK